MENLQISYSICLIILALLAQLRLISSNCNLEINGDSPIFATDFGTRKIVFKANEGNLYFDEGEILQVHCSTTINFSVLNYRNPNYAYRYPTEPQEIYDLSDVVHLKRDAILSCNAKQNIEYKSKNVEIAYDTKSKSAQISCRTSSNLNLFESKSKLPNCEKYANYALGVQLPDIGAFLTSGICYDLPALTLKFANYIAYETKNSFVVEEKNISSPLLVSIGARLNALPTYFQFVSENYFHASLKSLTGRKALLKTFEYDFTSLLQDTTLSPDLKQFSYIFNTIWWRQLRLHNWQYFLEALQQRTANKKYIVYIGTYGNITIPTSTSHCNQTETFTVKSEDSTVVAPAYIWAYLKSLETDSEPEEFVIIAHNSPFAQNPDSKAFCKQDICDDIPWLRASKFGGLRQIPTLGYTFCCRPDDVAKVIDYFPWTQSTHKMNFNNNHNSTNEK